MKTKKIILTDCDGVLLNWDYAFNLWMDAKGHKAKRDYKLNYAMEKQYNLERKEIDKLLAQFNESANIGFLPALRDATQYVTQLSEEGYEFHCITSMNTNKYSKKLRKKNLDKVFGKGVVTKLICLEMGGAKDKALSKYKDSNYWWIEDKPENCQVGKDQGLRPILIEHAFNMHCKDFPVAKTWKDVYNMITNETRTKDVK